MTNDKSLNSQQKLYLLAQYLELRIPNDHCDSPFIFSQWPSPRSRVYVTDADEDDRPQIAFIVSRYIEIEDYLECRG